MIAATPPDLRLIGAVSRALVPPAIVGSWDWVCEYGRTPEGIPFDGRMVPWSRGVCEAWDNPETRKIVLMWGTRLGKTSIGMQLLAKVAATHPRPGLFATSTEGLAKRTVKHKIYRVLSSIEATAKQLPPELRWSSTEIKLGECPWAVAWSGSHARLADYSAFYGFANEIDKWSFNESQGGAAGEGDTLAQFLERFKEFYNHKILFECSPSTRTKSRIEALLKQSNNCRFHVPCPQCGGHQVLRLGKEGESGGIRFDRNPDGTSEPELARKTARYVCIHCKYEIYDDQRPAMMNRGVWVPEGCEVGKTGRLKGTPKRSPRVWGSQLSSLYSLQLRWGDVAEEWLRVRKDAPKLRMFVNGWLAKTWEPFIAKSVPEQVGQRLTVETPRGVIPKWATHLFAGIDQQLNHLVFWVMATNHEEREHLVDHGTFDDFEEIEEFIIRKRFEHEDGGEPLWPAVTAIDCGFKTKDVYEFCQRFKGTKHKVLPIKGANTDCAGEPYEIKIIGVNEGQDARTKKILIVSGQGLVRLRANPFYYEPITHRQLEDQKLLPGDPRSLTLHQECREDLDLLRDLCNGAESKEPSKMDPNRHLWVKRWEGEPNDLRDAKKYARCVADHFFQRRWIRAKRRQVISTGGQPARIIASAADEHEGARGRRRFRPGRSERRGRAKR